MAALLSQNILCVVECGRFQSFSNSAKQAWQVERKGSMGLLTTRHLGDGLLPGGQALTGAPGPHLFCSPPPLTFTTCSALPPLFSPPYKAFSTCSDAGPLPPPALPAPPLFSPPADRAFLYSMMRNRSQPAT